MGRTSLLVAACVLGMLAFPSELSAQNWSRTGSTSSDRIESTATLLSTGQVLTVGGIGEAAVSERYDPATGKWTQSGALAAARVNHTATLLPSGQVPVAGGFNEGGVLASAALYDPATGTFSATGSMHSARSGHTASL